MSGKCMDPNGLRSSMHEPTEGSLVCKRLFENELRVSIKCPAQAEVHHCAHKTK